MQKIIPHLWFDTNAEEAVKFYTSIFNKGKVNSITRYTEAGFDIHQMRAGTVMSVEFEIEGYTLIALNGGPYFKITPAISFMVNRSSVEEVDALWKDLSEGGTALMPLGEYPFNKRYGWIQDKYGVSWQINLCKEVPTPNVMPSLLFVGDKAGRAEEAMDLYTSLFKDSRKGDIARYPTEQVSEKPGSIMYGEFFLAGQKFAAMDSSMAEHKFTFNEGVSLLVTCEDQAEIDHFWEKLSAVPESEQCGWLKDKYGVSWQIVPRGMKEILNSPDKEKAKRGMDAVMQMKKFDVGALKKAVE